MAAETWSPWYAPLVTIIGGIIWGVRLEGQVKAHDQRFEMMQVQVDERHDDLKDRLVRIETKLDKLQGE